MRNRFNIIAFLILFFSGASRLNAQVDSLWRIYNDKSKPDTVRLIAIHQIAWTYSSIKPDTVLLIGEQELQLAQKKGLKKFEAKAYNILGASYTNKGFYPKALENYFKALKKFEETNNKRGITNCYTNIGTLYQYQSNYPKALDYYFKALKICEETLLPDGSLANKSGTAACYTNIGNVYFYESNYRNALRYYLKALKINEQIDDKQGLAACYGNIGSVYQYLSNYSLALKYFMKDLSICRETANKQGASICYNNIGGLYIKLLNFKLAIQYCDTSLKLSEEIGSIDDMRRSYQNLAAAYSSLGQYKEAYSNHVKFKQLTDSIFNIDNSRELSDLRTMYQVEKKEAELKAEAKAQQAISAEEKKRQRFVIYGVAGVLLLVLVFAVFMSQRYRITQKQKHIIEKQKELVEEHRQEIIDSITYAKRLQQAILPSKEEITKHFPESFLLYKPKDIVAGDFYWMENIEGMTYIAAADCTGHGVPGAMVSVVCSNALNRAVKEFGLRETGKILDKARELVLETFTKSSNDVKDGMDISLFAINKNSGEIKWSGANNPLWYISNKKLIEIKPDKQTIGKIDNQTPFITHQVSYLPGSIFYLFTDGLPDQFGGPKGKKFKYKQLKDLLVLHFEEPMDQQAKKIETAFRNWMGNLEQVDDVCIIGIKI
ncbi:MAG: tetratricopeptide repeat protein [Bacteroidia bacterium]